MTEHDLQSLTADDYHEEARRRNLEDGAGFTPHAVNVNAVGFDPDTIPAPHHVSLQRPRTNRRGGRSYAEPSESELDPYWNAGKVSTEGMRMNREAMVARALAVMDVISHQAARTAEPGTQAYVRQQMVLSQKHFPEQENTQHGKIA